MLRGAEDVIDAEPEAGLFRRCANLHTPAACNWLLPAYGWGMHCIACSLNRTIPDLSIPENHDHWCKVEIAKRRLVAQLVSLISQDMSLKPGDIILCGTSVGVGSMKPGSTVEIDIVGIGKLSNRFE